MPIIEQEIWKPSSDNPGMITFDKQRMAQDIFNELEAHLKADGRMPDEYFLLTSRGNRQDGALFPRDANVISSVNFGSNEGIYIDISLRYEKDVQELSRATGKMETRRRMVTEPFAMGKTLGDSIEDLDRMNLVAASVTAAFYGNSREVRERYAQIESGELQPQYPRQPYSPEPANDTPKEQAAAEPYTYGAHMKDVLENHSQRDNPKFIELAERIDKNLFDYHRHLLGFGQRELIDMAGKMAAMSDAHRYMTLYHDFSNKELDLYLQFQNPLEVVADAWLDRNEDVGDVYYTVEAVAEERIHYAAKHAMGDFSVIPQEYPLMSDINPTGEPTLRRYMNIDLEQHLGEVAAKVLVHHPRDWEIDSKALRRAALSDNPEEKRLFWSVCGFGTQLVTEADTFIKDTRAFNAITEYRANDLDMFGFAVEVLGVDSESGAVKGNVFEVGDYAEFAQHIRKKSEPLESLTLIYSDAWGVNAGKAVNVSRKEYDNDRHRLMSESGNVVQKVYHPQDKVRLAGLVTYERSERMKLPMGSPGELLQRVSDKLAEVRKPPEKPEQAADKPKQATAEKIKPKSLADKLQAANEKAKEQDAKNSSTITNKRDKRDERS
jgi:hypothetical protein